MPGRIIPPAVPSPPTLSARSPLRSNCQLNCATAVHKLTMPGHENQWIFPLDIIRQTPSIHHGLSISEERSRRAKGVNFIIQAAIMLKLPQTTISTASIYFHRFYMRYSLVPEKGGLHHYPIAATSLFLATKAEENCRKTKEIVICVAKVAQKNPNLQIDEQSKEFWRWKDNILQFEETMLETLTFDIHVDSPYRILSPTFDTLGLFENKTLRNLAWAFLNDSALTHLCLVQPAKDITIASLFFALTHSGTELSDDEEGRPWWEQVGGSPQRIKEAMDVMFDLYEDNPLGKKDNPYDRSPGDTTELKLERTRHGFQNGNSVDSRSDGDSPGASAGRPSPPTSSAKVPVNGNGVSKEDGELTPNGKASSEKDVMESQTNGSSDEKLKEAANDPATHANTATDSAAPNMNGASTENAVSPIPTPKRKAAEVSDEAETNGASKRPRLENGTSTENGVTIENGTSVENVTKPDDDDEEEGELEE